MNDSGLIAIRFVTRKWPPAIGGMETCCVQLVEALQSVADLEVIALPGRSDGAPPTALSLFRFGVSTAIRLLFAKPTRVTHIGDMAIWPLAVVARLRSKRTRIVLSAHGTDVSYPFRGGPVARLYGRYLELGARLLPSSVVIANSTATSDVAKSYGFHHVTVVPLATDICGSLPTESHNASVLFVGRLIPRKGCAWFIRNVVSLLPASMTMRVAGTVRNEDERTALNNPRVTYLGPIHGDALIREYASALCVVIPTRDFEGFGLTAIEAAASGGLVVASDHSGLRQSVIDGVTGFLIQPGDAKAWADKIAQIHGWSPAQRRRFIERSLETIEQRFSWQRVAQDIKKIYVSLDRKSPS